MTFLDRLGEILFWPLVLAERREEKRRAEERAKFEQWVAGDKAYRAYKAAMSQASQAMQMRMNSARMLALAERTLEKGDRLLLDVGIRPEDHPRRARTVRRLEEAKQRAAANDNSGPWEGRR